MWFVEINVQCCESEFSPSRDIQTHNQPTKQKLTYQPNSYRHSRSTEDKDHWLREQVTLPLKCHYIVDLCVKYMNHDNYYKGWHEFGANIHDAGGAFGGFSDQLSFSFSTIRSKFQ